MDWSEWAQNVGGNLLNKAAEAKWVQPYETEKMRLQALGQAGYYTEGQRAPTAPAKPGVVAGISNQTLMLIGAGVVAVLLLTRGKR